MKAERLAKLRELTIKLNLELETWKTFNEALTHRTYVTENPAKGLNDNQRLEFLGDAILGMIIAEYLFTVYQDKTEGDLTRMRAAVVCEQALGNQATQLKLGEYLLLGKGEELTGGRERISNLADAVEAIIGAVYLELGLDITRKLILQLLTGEIEMVAKGGYRDYKTMLQELIHRLYGDVVSYEILKESGPDHQKFYEAGVFLKGQLLAKGSGKSKKEAEQQAADKALKILNDKK
ncbi:MAG: ribonuclease III [Bacillota bacterium]